MPPRTWAILTGEYPPMHGGVADYTRNVAVGLSQRGEVVHVWAPAQCDGSIIDSGVSVHRLVDHFGSRGLRQLEEQLTSLPKHTRILVQYVPHAFGMKAMNLPFCAAVQRLAERFEMDVMFHEVAMPMGRRLPLKWNIIGGANRVMARLLARAARRVLVSTSAWCATLQPMCRPDQAILLAPIPSNIRPCEDRSMIRAVRDRAGGSIVGHFGSLHEGSRKPLCAAVAQILGQRDDVRMLFVGGGSSCGGEWIRAAVPQLAERIIVTGQLDAAAVSAHIAACDVMLLPYIDGISTRRSSAMAALASGVALVTTVGHNTEALWNDHAAVTLAEVADGAGLGDAVLRLLRDGCLRTAAAAGGKALYDSQFSLARTLDVLTER